MSRGRFLSLLLAGLSMFGSIAAHATSLPFPTRLAKPMVTIDPGHGGEDTGGEGNGVKESEIVLAIGLQVKRLLEAHGVAVKMTRQDDTFIGLNERVEVARGTNLFVSIHANWANTARAKGVETYWCAKGGKLAQIVQESILEHIPECVDRGVKKATFLVIRKETNPAILVETGFVTNADEAKCLTDPIYQNRMADAIARGIVSYLGMDWNIVSNPKI